MFMLVLTKARSVCIFLKTPDLLGNFNLYRFKNLFI